MKLNSILFFFICFLCKNIFSQEALPVFQDYLSDNVFLVHPAAAGIGETGKIRTAIRMEGFGIANSPQVQTLNIHGKFNETSNAAFGVVLVNNVSNQSFSQRVLQGTYAYHLDIDKTTNFNQLSFGLAINGIFNQVGGQTFSSNTVSQVTQPVYYLNVDFGAAYHLKGLSSYFTIKNLYTSSQSEIFSGFNNINLKNYIFGLGYFYGDEKFAQYEPSILLQYKEETEEKVIDVNFKIYKNFDNAQIWGALSYRNSFGSIIANNMQYISPIVGLNVNKMVFSYSYSQQINQELFVTGPFHQIAIGINILPVGLKLPANPNINGILY